MLGDDEPLISEPLFLAVTRPAMWFGVPIEAGIPMAIAGVLVLIVSDNPIYGVIVAVVGFGIARLVVRHDPNAFRLLNLGVQTKWKNRDRAWWGGSSYSPLPVKALKRKGFAGE
ncbi:VirB3 family type IV secretion system protein [Sphingomonas sp. LB2R24]|uniref:type IV secretion system protein VirB3 n=1 Tax=unclassified Sphingomonas TaxID=196159 RepID=UPI000A30BDC1|nr:VirB3 family type IV secretion system protein [Sphingomonas sp. PAMC 26621]MBD8641538.1 VirB3 family type IV secretion system protein [Sphingomonas sp. CFBP 13733]MBD8737068.1 VirB3 family type IV secretion system protein [Sphingomonas sp. CFBP 13706]RYF22964.1 MAG: type VI secretion protein [Oxalobacteraceae bacterium]